VFVAVADVRDFALAEVAAEVRSILAATYRFVPEAVALIDRRKVPRTPLGKVRRLELAAAVGDARFENQVHRLGSGAPPLAARQADGEIEQAVVAVWAQLLRCSEDFDRDADFFALGGDSIRAAQLSLSLEQKFGIRVPFERFANRVSVREIARYVRSGGNAGSADTCGTPIPNSAADGEALPGPIVARLHAFLRSWPGKPIGEDRFLRRVGSARCGLPVFWCMPDVQDALAFEATVAARRPAFTLRSFNLLVEYGAPAAKALARRYSEEIQEAFPEGPYLIAGNCQGAIVALDVARELICAGRRVQALVIADTPPFELFQEAPFYAPVIAYLANRSKFNPYRKYRFPAQGLKKLLPAGCRMTMISAEYSRFMIEAPLSQVEADLEDALIWAERAGAAPLSRAPGAYPTLTYYNSIFASVSELKLSRGETARIDLELCNRSGTDWGKFESSGITVGNHWLSPDGEVLVWSDGRAPLTEPIAAGSKGAATLEITAPAVGGRYLLEVDLIEEGVRWFGERASPPLHIPVIVEEPAPAPETLILHGASSESNPGELNASIRMIRSDVRGSALPGWRKLSAKLFLSLAKRAVRF